MYSMSDEPSGINDLFAKTHDALSDLLSQLPSRKPILIPRTADIFSEEQHMGKLYVLTEGNLLWTYEDKDLFVFEPGDLLGLPERCGIKAGRIRGEFAVYARELGLSEISRPEFKANWEKILQYHYAAMASLAIRLMQGERVFSPHVQSYEPGQIIIEQGTIGTEVFTLLEGGSAEVSVDGVKVGEVTENELFGVFAALTGCPRSATVTATTPSLAVLVTKEEFIELMRHKPNLVMKAMTDLTQTIMNLNAKVVELSGK